MVAAAAEFSQYGPSHWLAVGVFAVGATLLVHLGRNQRTTARAQRFSRFFAATLLVVSAVDLVYDAVPPSLERSVPLHLSDLVPLVAAYALLFRRPWAHALAYYWGLALSTQALISPALTGPDFPHPNYLLFWGGHLLAVLAAIYLTWGLGMRVDWRSYRLAIAVTVGWAAVTMTFNTVAGTNYGFLNGTSDTASILDVLGPWPGTSCRSPHCCSRCGH
ncbi:TIGR02206 family membrane protein [Saccharomonospora sp. CUA-673]|uniref:YwaF family protein n=1 Tax=Saccharomonospora sp. CUA-673 TaxID=1904969 RepID=UPI00351429FD